MREVLERSQDLLAHYLEAIYDFSIDKTIVSEPKSIEDNVVIITDGSYLFKTVYYPHWDLKIYLKTNFKTALKRGGQRDAALLCGYEGSKTKFKARYHAASRRYSLNVKPECLADVIIDNTDVNAPKILTNSRSVF